jgi:ornithine carbamoyltransferase
MKDLVTLKDWTQDEINHIIDESIKIKSNPNNYLGLLKEKTLLMIFEKPSLRTRLSFEAAMAKLGGSAVFYDLNNAPLKKGESWEDTIGVISRYYDFIMARLFNHDLAKKIAKSSSIPFINGLTDFCHPMQILADLMTIKEKFNKIDGLNIAYFGDANNNVTNSHIFALSKYNVNFSIACPLKENYIPNEIMMKHIKENNKNNIKIIHNTNQIKNQDIIMTDTWMSYHIDDEQKEIRKKDLIPYQVNNEIMSKSNNSYFMHCMPAYREQEVTTDVIDGKQSIIFDQAENRMWTSMAVLLYLNK